MMEQQQTLTPIQLVLYLHADLDLWIEVRLSSGWRRSGHKIWVQVSSLGRVAGGPLIEPKTSPSVLGSCAVHRGKEAKMRRQVAEFLLVGKSKFSGEIFWNGYRRGEIEFLISIESLKHHALQMVRNWNTVNELHESFSVEINAFGKTLNDNQLKSPLVGGNRRDHLVECQLHLLFPFLASLYRAINTDCASKLSGSAKWYEIANSILEPAVPSAGRPGPSRMAGAVQVVVWKRRTPSGV